jgi:hypothetical protein
MPLGGASERPENRPRSLMGSIAHHISPKRHEEHHRQMILAESRIATLLENNRDELAFSQGDYEKYFAIHGKIREILKPTMNVKKSEDKILAKAFGVAGVSALADLILLFVHPSPYTVIPLTVATFGIPIGTFTYYHIKPRGTIWNKGAKAYLDAYSKIYSKWISDESAPDSELTPKNVKKYIETRLGTQPNMHKAELSSEEVQENINKMVSLLRKSAKTRQRILAMSDKHR